MRAVAFDLVVPMASWAAGGASIVPTQTIPTWSAIVGLMGAAMGVPRSDPKLVGLAHDYALAVRVDKPGHVDADYHTIQSPAKSEAKRLRPSTRVQELSVKTINTTITRRDYVHDAAYRIFVVQFADAPCVSLEEIVVALANPVYPLSAGRRSCLIGSLHASIVGDEDIETATHWDQRLPMSKSPKLVKERHDQLIGNRTFGVRFECWSQ